MHASHRGTRVHGCMSAQFKSHAGIFNSYVQPRCRYKEVVETVLRFKDSKEKLIRRAVLVLVPRLAAFAPERFAAEYLSKCIAHVLSVLKHPGELHAVLLRLVGCDEA